MNTNFKLIFLSLIIVLFSCNKGNITSNAQQQNIETNESIKLDSIIPIKEDTILSLDSTSIIDLKKNILSDNPKEINYLIANYFNTDINECRKEYNLIKNREWSLLSISPSDSLFRLVPITLDTVQWYDECNGRDMLTITSNLHIISVDEIHEIKDQIYISGLQKMDGIIPSHFHKQLTILPDDPYTFEFNGKSYTLRAEAEKYNTEPNTSPETDEFGRKNNEVFGIIKYKLFLESEGKKQILNSGSYDSTCLKILFIGDLDGDGKADFLFETNDWYEGDEVTLFLSSQAEDGELVKNMGASGNYFDC